MKNAPLYILIDFSCGRFYTHHSSYLQDYERFLLSQDAHVEIWVNNSADPEVMAMFSSTTKRVLHSTLYSHSRKSNFLLFALNRTLTWFFSSKNLNGILRSSRERIKNAISFLYLINCFKLFKIYSKRNIPIRLVFPTIDGLGIRLSRFILNNKKYNVDFICMRVVGAEVRGAFGVLNSTEVITSLSMSHQSKLRIGFETKAMEDLFVNSPKNLKEFYWAPMPSVVRCKESTVGNLSAIKGLKLGFLGSARKNKGFEDIPRVLSALKEAEILFHAFIQKPIFYWPNSNKVMDILLQEHPGHVSFLEGSSKKELIDAHISQMDLLILPYNATDYQYAGSGILFIASDFKVPVATFHNLGFTWDIENFNQGIVFSTYQDLAKILKSFNPKIYNDWIYDYNISRNSANNSFLF